MGYIGDWSNLKQNLERSKERIAQMKTRQRKRVSQKSDAPPKTPVDFSSLSLVEKRNRLINKIRWVMLLIVLVLTVLLMYLL